MGGAPDDDDLRTHVVNLYGKKRYLTETIQNGRHPIDAVAYELDEKRAMQASLHSTKHATLQHLHERLHQILGDRCTPGDWYTTTIHEHSSLEDVMAATKAAKQNTTKAEIRYVPDAKIGEVWVKAQMGQVEGFLDPAEMDLIDMPGFVAQRRSASHPRNLETIYNYYQKIDGAPEERTEQLKVRSMSTGDAIVIDGTAYYVTAKGFVTVVDGKVIPVEAPEA